jgi:hypothetical protein
MRHPPPWAGAGVGDLDPGPSAEAAGRKPPRLPPGRLHGCAAGRNGTAAGKQPCRLIKSMRRNMIASMPGPHIKKVGDDQARCEWLHADKRALGLMHMPGRNSRKGRYGCKRSDGAEEPSSACLASQRTGCGKRASWPLHVIVRGLVIDRLQLLQCLTQLSNRMGTAVFGSQY